MKAPPFQEVLPMYQSTYDKLIEQGRAEERAEGLARERALIRKMLERRFGALSAAALQRLEGLSAEQLEQLGLAMLDAPSLQTLGFAD